MNKYRTTLMNRPFMYIESKRVAEMMLQGKTEEERWYEAIELNALQMPSPDRRKTSYKEISHRLSFLDDFLLGKFMDSDADTAKAILAYAIMLTLVIFTGIVTFISMMLYHSNVLIYSDAGILKRTSRPQSAIPKTIKQLEKTSPIKKTDLHIMICKSAFYFIILLE